MQVILLFPAFPSTFSDADNSWWAATANTHRFAKVKKPNNYEILDHAYCIVSDIFLSHLISNIDPKQLYTVPGCFWEKSSSEVLFSSTDCWRQSSASSCSSALEGSSASGAVQSSASSLLTRSLQKRQENFILKTSKQIQIAKTWKGMLDIKKNINNVGTPIDIYISVA